MLQGGEGTHSDIPLLAHLRAVSHARQLNILLHQPMDKRRGHAAIRDSPSVASSPQCVVHAPARGSQHCGLRHGQHSHRFTHTIGLQSLALRTTTCHGTPIISTIVQCAAHLHRRMLGQLAAPLKLLLSQSPLSQYQRTEALTPYLHRRILGQLAAPLHLLPGVLLAPHNADGHADLLRELMCGVGRKVHVGRLKSRRLGEAHEAYMGSSWKHAWAAAESMHGQQLDAPILQVSRAGTAALIAWHSAVLGKTSCRTKKTQAAHLQLLLRQRAAGTANAVQTTG